MTDFLLSSQSSRQAPMPAERRMSSRATTSSSNSNLPAAVWLHDADTQATGTAVETTTAVDTTTEVLQTSVAGGNSDPPITYPPRPPGVLSFNQPTLLLAAGLSQLCFEFITANIGTANISWDCAGPACERFNDPGTFSVTVNQRSPLNISSEVDIDFLYALQTSPAFALSLTEALPPNQWLDVAFVASGVASSGVQITPPTLKFESGGGLSQTFTVTAGLVPGLVAFDLLLDGPAQFAHIAPGRGYLEVKPWSTISTTLGVKVDSSSSTDVTFNFSDPVSQGLEISISVMSSVGGLLTPSTTNLVVSPNSTAASFTITAAALTGVAQVTYSLSGVGAAQFAPIQPNEVAVVSAGMAFFIAPEFMFTEQTDQLVLVLGAAVPSGGTAARFNPVASAVSDCGGDTGCPGISFSKQSVTFPADGVTDVQRLTVTTGTWSGLIKIEFVATAGDFSSPAPRFVRVNSRATTEITVAGTVIGGQSVVGTLQIHGLLPSGTSVSVFSSLSGTAASGSTISPNPMVFGGSNVKQTFSLTAGSTLQDLTLSFVVNGTGAFAVDPTINPVVLAVMGNMSVSSIPSLATLATSDQVTVTLSHAIPAGLDLTVSLSTTAGTLAVPSSSSPSATQRVVVSGLTFTFNISTPQTPGYINITFSPSGTAAGLFNVPGVLSVLVQATMSFVPNAVTIAQGGTSSTVYLTLSSPLPPTADSGLLIAAGSATGAAGSSVFPDPPGFFVNDERTQLSFNVLSDGGAMQVGRAQIPWTLAGESAENYANPGLLTVTVKGEATHDVSSGFSSGQTQKFFMNLSAPVPASSALTITVTATPSATKVTPAALYFAAGATTTEFSVSSQVTTSSITASLSFVLSGTAQSMYSSIPTHQFNIAGAGVVSFIPPTTLYTGECQTVPVFLGTAVTTGSLSIAPSLSGSGSTGASGSTALIDVLGREGSFELCAGTTAGNLIVSLTLSGATAGSYTFTAQTVTVKSRLSVAFSIPGSYEVTTGSTVTVTSTLNIGHTEAITINVASSLETSTTLTGVPLVLSAGATSATFSVTFGYIVGTVSLSYSTTSRAVASLGADVFQVAFPPPSFVYSSITENTNSPGAFNRYTITFQPSQPLYSGTTLVVAGFNTASDESEAVTITEPGSSNFESKAQLSSGAISFKIRKNRVVSASANTTFTLYLVNPSTAASAAPVMTLEAVGSIPKQTFLINIGISGGGVGMADGGSSFGLRQSSAVQVATTSTISEATQVNGAMNTITLSLKTSQNIAVGSTITLCGFPVTMEPTTKLAVTGQHAANVGNVAELRIDRDAAGAASMTAVFYVETDLPTSGPAVMSFQLRNPMSAHSASSIIASVGTSNTPVPPTQLSGSVMAAGTAASGAVTGTVVESSTVPSASNTLTFTITPSATVSVGSTVVIGNLSNAIDAPGLLQLTPTTTGLGSSCTYSMGTATCSVEAALAVGSAVTFSFALQNPRSRWTTMLNVWAAVQGPVPLPATTLTGSVLGAGSPEVVAWELAEVTESNSVTGQQNTLTICLRPSADVAAGTSVMIRTFSSQAQTANTASSYAVHGATLWEGNRATFTNGVLSFTVASSGVLPSITTTCASIELTNPSSVGAGSSLTIVTSGGTTVTEKSLGTVLSPTVTTATWSSAEYSQTSRLPGAPNTVQLCLKPAVELPIGSTISVTFGAMPAPATATVLPVYGDSAYFGGVGRWTRETGVLSLRLGKPWPVTQACFHVQLRNPMSSPTTRTVSIATTLLQTATATAAAVSSNCGTGSIVSGSSFPNCGGSLFAVDQNWLTQADLVQTTSTCPASGCAIRLSVRPAVDLSAGSSLTISGLTHVTSTTASSTASLFQSSTASTTSLALDNTATACNGTTNSDDVGVLGTTASWNQTGTLVLTVATGKTLVATRTVCVELALRAPAASGSLTALTAQIGSTSTKASATGVWSSTATPTLVTSNPQAGSYGLSTRAPIDLTFDRHMEVTGQGTISFTLPDGTRFGSAISCTGTADDIAVSGKSVRVVVPSAVSTPPAGQKLLLTISSDCLKAIASNGNKTFPGVQSTDFHWYLAGSTDGVRVKSILLGKQQTSKTMNKGEKTILLNFDQDIALAGTGSARIYRSTDRMVLASISLTTQTTLKSSILKQNYANVYNSTLNLTLASDVLVDEGTCVTLMIPRGSIVSLTSGVPVSDYRSDFCIPTSDGVPALSSTAASSFPASNAANVIAGTTSLSLTFDSDVAAGSGNIQIHRASNTMNANPSGAVAVRSCSSLTMATTTKTLSLTIDDTALYTRPTTVSDTTPASQCFYVLADAGCVRSATNANAMWTGLRQDEWSFCISDPPSTTQAARVDVDVLTPASGTQVTAGEAVTLKMQFNQLMSVGLGYIHVWAAEQSGSVRHVLSQEAKAVAITTMTTSGMAVSVASFTLPAAEVTQGRSLYVTVADSAFIGNSTGRAFAGYVDSSSWFFRVAPSLLADTTCALGTNTQCSSSAGASIIVPSTAVPPGVDSVGITESVADPSSIADDGGTMLLMGNQIFLSPTGTQWLGSIKTCFSYNCDLNDPAKAVAFSAGTRQIRKQFRNPAGQLVWGHTSGSVSDDRTNCQLCTNLQTFSHYIPVSHQPPSSPGAPPPSPVPGQPPGPSATPTGLFFSAAPRQSVSVAMACATALVVAALCFWL